MKKLIFLSLLILFISCEKDKVQNIDCDKFYVGVTTLNESIVKSEIEKLTVDLEPAVMPEDEIGHLQNMETLVSRLNENCDTYSSSIQCYSCIRETFPVQSEVLIEFRGNQKFIITLHTPENDILRFAGIRKL